MVAIGATVVMDPVLALTTEQMGRLTGLSERQLDYWSRTGFFTPSISADARRRYGRIYSFRDAVALRTLALLREQVSLQELRKIKQWLYEHDEHSWAELRFFVRDGRVYFQSTPEMLASLTAPRGQTADARVIELGAIIADTEQRARRLRERQPEQFGGIERHRHIAHNAPVLAGTRIPTAFVYDLYDAGYTVDEIIGQYPTLTPADVTAAIEFEEQRAAATAS